MDIVSILTDFSKRKIWVGTIEEREKSFEWLNEQINRLYHKNYKLVFELPSDISKWFYSGDSCADSKTHTITLRGRLSVITYLHEVAHLLLKTGNQLIAQSFAVSLFKEVFPEKFEKLQLYDGYSLVSKAT